MIAAGGRDQPSIGIAMNAADFGSGQHFPALRANFFDKRPADGGIIGDAFLGNVNSGETGGVRLPFAKLVAGKPAQPLQSVGSAAL